MNLITKLAYNALTKTIQAIAPGGVSIRLPSIVATTPLVKTDMTAITNFSIDAGAAVSVGRWTQNGNLVTLFLKWNTVTISTTVASFSFRLPSSVPYPKIEANGVAQVYDNSGSVITLSAISVVPAGDVGFNKPTGTYAGGTNTSYIFGQISWNID